MSAASQPALAAPRLGEVLLPQHGEQLQFFVALGPDATIITVSSGLAFAPLKITPSYNASNAAIHMLSESIRLQFAGTTVKVVELEPPSVRTALLPGQEDTGFAMPLEEFVAEAVALLESHPGAKEIQVERVKFLRHGAARGDYDQVVETLTRPTRTGNSQACSGRGHAEGETAPGDRRGLPVTRTQNRWHLPGPGHGLASHGNQVTNVSCR